MKTLTLTIGLCLIGAILASAQSAAAVSVCATAAGCVHRVPPVPLIGVGLPAFLSVGVVLLAVMLLKRRRQ